MRYCGYMFLRTSTTHQVYTFSILLNPLFFLPQACPSSCDNATAQEKGLTGGKNSMFASESLQSFPILRPLLGSRDRFARCILRSSKSNTYWSICIVYTGKKGYWIFSPERNSSLFKIEYPPIPLSIIKVPYYFTIGKTNRLRQGSFTVDSFQRNGFQLLKYSVENFTPRTVYALEIFSSTFDSHAIIACAQSIYEIVYFEWKTSLWSIFCRD